MSRLRAALLAPVALGLGLLAACTGDAPAPEEVSTAEALPPAASERLAAVPGAPLSRRSPVVVTFAEPVVAPDQVGRKVPSPLAFTPRVAGEATWTSTAELTFTPDDALEAGAAYAVAVDLGALRADWAGEEAGFTVRVLPASYRTQILGLRATASAPDVQRLEGLVHVADPADGDAVEGLLTAKQDGRDLEVSWAHDEGSTAWRFTVDGIARADRPGEVALAFDGAALGLDRVRTETVTVPAKGAFTLVASRPVTDVERFVELRFSEPVDPDQSLDGLVRVTAGDDGDGEPLAVRAEADGSVVRVYARERWPTSVTLRVEGLRDASGRRIEDAGPVTVGMAPPKPEVRFAGSGVVLPTTAEPVLPVQVANVSGLTITATAIPASNVARFLQDNALDGGQRLLTVGRPVWREHVALDLGADQRDRWVTVGLDVSELVAAHPAGLYRLEVSFGPGDVMWDCGVAVEPTDPSTLGALEPDWEGLSGEDSFWDLWADDDGTSYWEKWENRENPCHAGYFEDFGGHDVEAGRNIALSDVGVIAKQGADGRVHALVTDLRTAMPWSGAQVTVLDYQLQPLGSARADDQGRAMIEVTRKPFALKAEAGDHTSWLRLGRGEALSVAHFDTQGVALEDGLKGFVYGERGVWRPGDPMHLTLVVHDETGRLPDDHPAHVALIDPYGQRVDQRVVPGGVDGFYDVSMTTAADAPTGTWSLVAKVGGATFRRSLPVETIVPNRLKIDLPLGDLAAQGPDPVLDTTLSSRWLTGAVARDLDAEIAVSLSPAATAFPGFEGFTFTDPTASLFSEEELVWSGVLDGEGDAPVVATLDLPETAPGLLNARFVTRVFEEGGASSKDVTTEIVSPHRRYVGIKTPQGDATRGMLLTDTPHPVEIVAVDAQGQPTGDGRVAVALYEVSWRWWWEAGDDDFSDYAGSEEHEPVAEGVVDLKDGRGTWSFEVKYPAWGRYLLVARDLDGTHAAGETLYIDWPGWAGRAQADNPGGASVLSVTADAEAVAVGEDVVLRIPTPQAGRILVSLETGTEVLETHWVEPTGDTTTFSFPATPEMAPSLYAHVMLIQPHGAANDRPTRLYGIVPVEVVDPGTQLSPTIATADRYAPDSTARIEVSEASGRPMTYTLAVVDEGLLGLTRFQTPDPWKAFNAREALGVRTWDLFSHVAGASGGALEGLLAVGGGGVDDAPADDGRKRFAPVVEVLGPFRLEAGATNPHSVDLGTYVGEVRVMVVGGRDGAWGHAEQSVPVTAPLMTLATVPRVLGPSERVAIPVDVFALERALDDVTVAVSVEGPARVLGEARRTVDLEAGGDRMVRFELAVDDALGDVVVTVTAEGGGESAKHVVPVVVRHPGTPETRVAAGRADADAAFVHAVEPFGLPGTDTLTVEVSRVPPMNLGTHLDALLRYPHGCLEQTTSAAFPQVALADVVELTDPQRAAARANVDQAIERLQAFQRGSGGFSYWPSGREVNDWATSYAGHFLVSAERAGHLLPAGMKRRWIGDQTERAERWVRSGPRDDLAQAYRLFTLALAGEPALGAMNRLREVALSDVARWRLAAAYALAGQAEAGRALVKGAGVEVLDYAELSGTFGSGLRDRALILESLVLLGEVDRARGVAETIAQDLSSDRLRSTQSTAYALLGLSAFAGAAPDGETAYRWSLGGASGDVSSDAPITRVDVPVSAGSLSVEGAGGPLYVRVAHHALPPVGGDTPVGGGARVEVVYVDREGTAIDPRTVAQGTDLTARITVTNTTGRDLPELAITHPIPSGWEIRDAASGPGDGFEHRDVRDDRVLAYVDLEAGASITLSVAEHASFLGRTYLAPTVVEAMYDPSLTSRTVGRWVDVVDGREL